jgi:hypothetical protein
VLTPVEIFADGVAAGTVIPGVVKGLPKENDGVGDASGIMGETVSPGVGIGAGVAALHPASVPARSKEATAMIMNVFFILFTFPFGFLHYCARNACENAGIG